MNSEHFFKLFASCIPVRGYKRAIIYDIQRNKSETIPISLYRLLNKGINTKIEKILSIYGKENKKIIIDYFSWLIKNEYGFFCNNLVEAKCFPQLSIKWDMPHVFTNAIIEIDNKQELDCIKIFSKVLKFGIPHVQIIIRKSISKVDLLSIANFFDRTRIKTIDIIASYSVTGINISEILHICKLQLRFNIIILYNAPFNKQYEDIKGLTNVFFTKKTLQDEQWCGNISNAFFSINKELFTESQHYNTCLNRKICIDANGEIKNCPAMSHSFGNIKDTTLEEALNKPGFKDLWGIRKDDIDVCKDCEFRYMCTDCRAFIKDPKNIYSQPAKCPYNPYIAKWEGEEDYITVEEWRTQNPNWEKKAKRKPLVKNPQKVE